MSESIFSAFGITDIDAVQTDPFKIPRNRYEVTVTGAEVKLVKEIKYFIVEFTISDPASEHTGKSVDSMNRIQPWTDAERAEQGDTKTMNARTIGQYKLTLLQLGIAPTMLGTFDPNTMGQKLLGIKGTADIGPNNKGYNNLFEFTRQATASSPEATAQATQAVSAPAVDASALDALMNGF